MKKNVEVLEFFGFRLCLRTFQGKNSNFFSHQTDFDPSSIHLVFFIFYRRPFRTLGVTLGSQILIAGGHRSSVAPIMGRIITAVRFFRLTGQMAGHPWLARIYYCLRMAGHKPSASALLYKPYLCYLPDG